MAIGAVQVRGFHLDPEVFGRFAALAREGRPCWMPGALSKLMLADGAQRMTQPAKDYVLMVQQELTACRAPMEGFSQPRGEAFTKL